MGRNAQVRRAALLIAIATALGSASTGYASTLKDPPKIKIDDSTIGASAKGNGIDHGTRQAGDNGGAPPMSQRAKDALPAGISRQPKVKGPKSKDKVEVKTEPCNDMRDSRCSSARTACITASGDPSYFKPPTITSVKVNDGPWTYSGMSCGVPASVSVPSAPGQPDQPAQTVAVQPPPVPTLGQIQSAFRSLPFSKPSVTV
ncbi:MAG: hypothetical protein ACTMHL_06540, partial [Janibacter sp.]